MAELCIKIWTQADANRTQTNYAKTEKSTKGESERQGANARRSFKANKSDCRLKVTRRTAGKGVATKTSTKADNNGHRTRRGAKSDTKSSLRSSASCRALEHPPHCTTLARTKLESKKEEVSSLQVKWPESKEKKQVGNLGKAEALNALKGVWTNIEGDESRRAGLQQPQNRARREAENEVYIGDMRNPGVSVSKLPRLQPPEEMRRDCGTVLGRTSTGFGGSNELRVSMPWKRTS